MEAHYGEIVGANLEALEERVAAAAARAGRDPVSIEIVAVTKLHPPEAVAAAWEAGLRRFGENRVQEAELKYGSFVAEHREARLDLLGHLQGNKVNKALRLFDRIESIDSVELLRSLLDRLGEREAAGRGGLEVLFELHTAEDSKSGFPDREALLEACRFLAARTATGGPALVPRGLMTMAPFTEDEASIRASFGALRGLREEIAREFGFASFDVLSMGMSGDFELAVEEGATSIRIGTALFGSRA